MIINRILEVFAAFLETALVWSTNLMQKERKCDCYCATVFNKFKNYNLDKFDNPRKTMCPFHATVVLWYL